jgi:3-oxoacyl-[acyl-carrier protein] reductase
MGDLFKDKVVIVTGSGQGIGRAIAKGFGAEGASVVTNNRKPGSTGWASMTQENYDKLSPERKQQFDDAINNAKGDAETTAREIQEAGGIALPIYADISKWDECESLVKTTADKFGTVDIVINVAGAFGGSPMHEMPEEMWDTEMLIKPKGYFMVDRFAIPYMLEKKWGRIIQCTSKAFMGDILKFAHYCTANAGVVGLTQAIACEYCNDGITANAFAPWARTRASYDGDFSHEHGGEIEGMRHFPTAAETPLPEALVPMIEYLCTDDAKDITGTVFTLGGNDISLHQFPIIAKSMSKFGDEIWTVDEIARKAPNTILRGYNNVLAYQ